MNKDGFEEHHFRSEDGGRVRILRPSRQFSDEVENSGQLLEFYGKVASQLPAGRTYVNCRQGLSRSVTFAALHECSRELASEMTRRASQGSPLTREQVSDRVCRVLPEVADRVLGARFGDEGGRVFDARFPKMLVHALLPDNEAKKAHGESLRAKVGPYPELVRLRLEARMNFEKSIVESLMKQREMSVETGRKVYGGK